MNWKHYKNNKNWDLSEGISGGGQNSPQFLGINHSIVVLVEILESLQNPVVRFVFKFLKETDELFRVVDDQTILICVGSIQDPLDVTLGGIVADALKGRDKFFLGQFPVIVNIELPNNYSIDVLYVIQFTIQYFLSRAKNHFLRNVWLTQRKISKCCEWFQKKWL